jgi:hypothetical protein
MVRALATKRICDLKKGIIFLFLVHFLELLESTTFPNKNNPCNYHDVILDKIMWFLCNEHEHSHMSFKKMSHMFEYLRYRIHANIIHMNQSTKFVRFLYEPMKTWFHTKFVWTYEAWWVCNATFQIQIHFDYKLILYHAHYAFMPSSHRHEQLLLSKHFQNS